MFLKPRQPVCGEDAASLLDRRTFLRVAVSGGVLLAAPHLLVGTGPAGANSLPGQSDGQCSNGDPGSYTAVSADRAGMFILFSDVHFDPFTNPGKVKALAAAPAQAWRGILADGGQGFSPYGQDSNDALFQSFLDDMAKRAPRPDFLLYPGDLLCHRFWTEYPRLTGDSTQQGLLAFIAKTVEYFLSEVAKRFPDVPLYLALGNNDSLEGDFRIAPKSPFLSATAPVIARYALKDESARASFLNTYPQYGCYGVPLLGKGRGRLVVFNNIFWAKRYPNQDAGRPVLDFLKRELSAADRGGEKVWLMAHVPLGNNSKSSAAKYLKNGRDVYDPMLSVAWNNALASLLVANAENIRAAFSGHVHRDEFRLVYPVASELPAVSTRLGPSVSPVTGNNPGYQVYSYDRDSLELLDMATYYLDLGASRPVWETEYRYSQIYGRGLRSAEDWQAMYNELISCPERGKAFAEAFDLRSSHVDEVTESTFEIFWDALGVRQSL